MPAFIKTPKDEARWAKAKKAAGKTLSESDGDSFWALTNSIYQKMNKSEDLELVESILLKARRRLSDEAEDPDDKEESLEDQGYREFDPEEGDDADKWLEENGPKKEVEEDEDEPDYYQEYGPDEDEESHQREPELDEEQVAEPDEPSEEPVAEAETPGDEGGASDQAEGGTAEGAPQEEPSQEVVSEGRFPQPTREELAEMRQYSRPWEQNAREKQRTEAEAGKNPVLAHQGRLIEARNAAHKSQQDAFAEFQASPEYQGADPITQMEMDSNFEKDWHKNNPDYLANAAKLHSQAHVEGLQGMGEAFGRKKEDIQHIRAGGASPEMPMSVEEGMQHAGGTKGEEGTTGSMVQDPATAFASQHKKFLEEMGGAHEEKAGSKQQKYGQMASDYAKKLGSSGADLKSMISKHPADVQDRLKRIDSFKGGTGAKQAKPQAKSKVDQFFEKYHPLISMHAHKVLNKLGLDKKNVDLGALHEAGMHGLFQAMNDYEHDNPSKASFATHAGNKISGLMQTALRNQMQTPQQLTSEAKKFQQKDQASVPKITKMPKPEGASNE